MKAQSSDPVACLGCLGSPHIIWCYSCSTHISAWLKRILMLSKIELKPRRKQCSSSGTPPFVVTNNYRTAWKAYQHTLSRTHTYYQYLLQRLVTHTHIHTCTHINMQVLILLLFYRRFLHSPSSAVTFDPLTLASLGKWQRYSPSCALRSPCNASCPPPWWSTDWPRRFQGNSLAPHTHRPEFVSSHWDGVWRRRFRRTQPSYCSAATVAVVAYRHAPFCGQPLFACHEMPQRPLWLQCKWKRHRGHTHAPTHTYAHTQNEF